MCALQPNCFFSSKAYSQATICLDSPQPMQQDKSIRTFSLALLARCRNPIPLTCRTLSLGAHRCGMGMSLLSALVPSSFLSGSSPHCPYSFPPVTSTRITSNPSEIGHAQHGEAGSPYPRRRRGPCRPRRGNATRQSPPGRSSRRQERRRAPGSSPSWSPAGARAYRAGSTPR